MFKDYVELHKSREGKGGKGCFPPQDSESWSISPGKKIKFETQFGAFWRQIDGFSVFHLHEQNISIMQVVRTLF